MTVYIGTKLIRATPMTRQEYNDYRGWQLPVNEDGSDPGMLVEYMDGGRSNDSRHIGYISWSPLGVFNAAYRPIQGMSFGMALEALKHGHKVARKGWNGKGMWLILVPGTPSANIKPDTPYGRAGIEVTDILPHIDMWTKDSYGRCAMLCGWLASQTDMLSEDWEIVE